MTETKTPTPETKFFFTVEGSNLNSSTKTLVKHSETDKAICFTETKNICVYHPSGMIGSPYAKYADKKYYFWIPKSVLKKARKSGSSRLDDNLTSWLVILPNWFTFKVSREHFMKKNK